MQPRVRIDMCVDMHMDMHIDICVDMHMDMHIDMCGGSAAQAREMRRPITI